MANNKQKTAVEEFIDQLELKGNAWENASIKRIQISIDVSEYLELKKQATEMDKQQTINDWRDGFLNGRISVRRDDFSTPQEYYEETYGGDKK